MALRYVYHGSLRGLGMRVPPAALTLGRMKIAARFAAGALAWGLLSLAGASAAPSASVYGQVLDARTQRPVAGAMVTLSPQSDAGGTPSGADARSTLTDARGAFRLDRVATGSPFRVGPASYRQAEFLAVTAPRASGYAGYHGVVEAATSGRIAIRIELLAPTAVDRALLARVNALRARFGRPPLAYDSGLMIAARHWARYMAERGYYGHDCPQTDAECISAQEFEVRDGLTVSGQNIAALPPPATWFAAEAQIEAEIANCPGIEGPSCRYGEDTGHVVNLLQAAHWFGAAEARDGKSFDPVYGTRLDYFDEEMR